MAKGVGHEFESSLLKRLACIFNWNWLGASLVLLILWPGSARAEFLPTENPRADFWLPDGVVHAVLETNGVIYLGGEFTSLSPNLPTSAMLNAVNGHADLTFPPVSGIIYSAIPDGAGGWFIGGRFTRVGNFARTNLAHLLANHAVDPAWAPSTDATVHALKLVAEVLYVGGDFASVSGEPRRRLAAVNAISGAVASWNPDICCDLSVDNRARVLALDGADGRLYVGGFFNQIDGQAQNLLAAFDLQTGKIRPWPNAGFDPASFVASVKLAGDTLYVGGRFVNIGGAERQSIAALDAATGLATSWNPRADGEVLDVALQGRTVYLAGRFLVVAERPRFNLAGVDIDSGQATEWAPNPNDTVRKIAVAGRVIYAGGDFTEAGGAPRAGMAAFDAEQGAALNWIPETVGRGVQSLALNGDQIVASSGLHRDSKTRRRLAALDQRTGRVLDWNPGADNAVFALALVNDTVYVAGDFLSVSEAPRVRVAAVDALTGEVLPWNLNTAGPNGRVWALAIIDDRLFVAGGFSSVSGMLAPGLVALDPISGSPLNWRPTPNRSVFALEEFGNTLFTAGSFSSVASQPRRAFAQVNAMTPTPTGWNPDVRGSGSVGNTITRQGNTVYLGGNFTNVAGQPRRHLAALNATDATLQPWVPVFSSPFDSVQDVAATDDAIYVAGSFTNVGGRARAGLVALDPITAAPLNWDVRPANDAGPVSMRVVAAANDALYVGGAFTSLRGEPHRNFAVFPAIGAPMIVQHPIGTTLRRGLSTTLAASVAGTAPLSLQWQRNGTNVAGATNLTLALNNLQTAQSGIYALVASNALGLASSLPTEVLVTEPLGVSRALGNIGVSPGTNIQFSIVATGSPPPRFQWKLNGVPVPGAEGPTFSLDNVDTADSGVFNVTIYNGIDTIESARAALSVNGVTSVSADSFASRTVLTGAAGTVIGHNGASTREPGEALHAGKIGGRSIWFSWIAPASGVATFSTRGCAFDTLLAVYTNVLVSGTNLVAADDDGDGYFTSTVTFSAEAGKEYQIVVDGYGGASGRVVFHWESTAIPEAVPVILRQPAGLSVAEGANAVFNVGARGPGLSYQWYRSGRLLLSGTNATLTITNVRSENVGAYSVVVRSGDRTVESARASLELGTVPPVVTQDKFQDLFVASLSTRVPLGLGSAGRQLLDNTGSDTQTLEPNHGNFPGGSSRWIRFRTTTNVLVQIDTLGSEIDTTLSIYTGTNLSTLSLVGRDNNGAPDGARSLLRFTPNSSTEYQVAVDGANGAQGKICLNWQQGVPPVSIASFATREVRIGTSVTLTAGTYGAAPAPTYRWLLNGVLIANATNDSLLLANFQATNAGTYSVIASNFAGMVTNIVAGVTLAPQFRLNYGLVFTGGVPRVRLTGPLTNQITIESTDDLIQWSELHVFNHVMPLDFLDLDPRGLRSRYYRALLSPPTKPDMEWTTTNGQRAFRLRGALGRHLIIEGSPDLESWSPLLTNDVVFNLDFTDAPSTNPPLRFYWLRPVP